MGSLVSFSDSLLVFWVHDDTFTKARSSSELARHYSGVFLDTVFSIGESHIPCLLYSRISCRINHCEAKLCTRGMDVLDPMLSFYRRSSAYVCRIL